ncbi:MAG: hypothetical protein IBX61_01645 [Thermoleophilia bacterium]|nr:hypothetical protein [Thermoleophilia bacterium]
MSKSHQNLIIVWSVVCASGLGIFLFQIFTPAVPPQTGYDSGKLALAIGFFFLLWSVPAGLIWAAGRRQKE